jgi:hypothetical protein
VCVCVGGVCVCVGGVRVCACVGRMVRGGVTDRVWGLRGEERWIENDRMAAVKIPHHTRPIKPSTSVAQHNDDNKCSPILYLQQRPL